MVKFKVDINDFFELINDIKKGISTKANEKDDYKGIRFYIVGDKLRGYATDGYKIYTSECEIQVLSDYIEDDFEFLTPIIPYPSSHNGFVTITVDYETRNITYDFGKSFLQVEMYMLNLNLDPIKEKLEEELYETDERTIIFNANLIKKIFDGFGTKETVLIKFDKNSKSVTIQSRDNKKKKRFVYGME